MAEHTVWAKIEDGAVTAVHLASHPGFVPATLTIPDETEWYVRFDPLGGGRIVIDPAATMRQCVGDVIVRAPDAQTALARALAARNHD